MRMQLSVDGIALELFDELKISQENVKELGNALLNIEEYEKVRCSCELNIFNDDCTFGLPHHINIYPRCHNGIGFALSLSPEKAKKLGESLILMSSLMETVIDKEEQEEKEENFENAVIN